jgi:hypothetical protein
VGSAASGGGGAEPPEIGVPYPVELYSRGRIRFVTFRRRRWETATPQPDPPRRLGPQAVTGTMELLAPDRLRFTITGPGTPESVRVLFFRPAAGH